MMNNKTNRKFKLIKKKVSCFSQMYKSPSVWEWWEKL
jgi:hypothetical protein